MANQKQASLIQAAKILREVASELKTSGLTTKSASWGEDSIEPDSTLDDYMGSQYSDDYDEIESIKRSVRPKSASATSYGRPVTDDVPNSPRIDKYASIDQEFLDLSF